MIVFAVTKHQQGTDCKLIKDAYQVTTRKNSNTPLFALDLFAGAGGLSLAARQVGLNVLGAVEYDHHCLSTYRRNLLGGSSDCTELYHADIFDVSPEEVKETLFSRGRECDVIIGGPPCQGFSEHRIKDSGVGDTRNSLIHCYFDFVKKLNAKCFVMENVPGMLWPRHENYLHEFYASGKAAGYTVLQPIILDARNFGVPQRRKRVFIVGYQNGLGFQFDWPPLPTHGDEAARQRDPSLEAWLDSSHVFRKAPNGDPNDIHMNHKPYMVEMFRNTPKNGGSRKDSGRTLKCHKNHDGHKDVYGRIDQRKPGPTMTTACVNPSKGRFVHPFKDHGITVRQAARFQCFPDEFIFEGGLMSAAKQIGNAVPIPLGKAVLRQIVKGLRF